MTDADLGIRNDHRKQHQQRKPKTNRYMQDEAPDRLFPAILETKHAVYV
jgi:hypothetical protein